MNISASAMASGEVTGLLAAMSRGDPGALDRLMPIVYDELHAIAGRHIRGEASWHTLGATALLHEAYLRLVGIDRLEWQDRAHFFALSSRLMRQVLLNRAERRGARKRGGGRPVLPLDGALAHADGFGAPDRLSAEDVLALESALSELEMLNERAARVVECRWIAGLDLSSTAEALGTSPATVKRDWTFARAWLNNRLAS
ncbi:MAG: ECF-type sigma factor [Gemmatimonadota bacterium]|nr:ECF-type sigma factor [Gemmatimonadota bacterium]